MSIDYSAGQNLKNSKVGLFLFWVHFYTPKFLKLFLRRGGHEEDIMPIFYYRKLLKGMAPDGG